MRGWRARKITDLMRTDILSDLYLSAKSIDVWHMRFFHCHSNFPATSLHIGWVPVLMPTCECHMFKPHHVYHVCYGKAYSVEAKIWGSGSGGMEQTFGRPSKWQYYKNMFNTDYLFFQFHSVVQKFPKWPRHIRWRYWYSFEREIDGKLIGKVS